MRIRADVIADRRDLISRAAEAEDAGERIEAQAAFVIELCRSLDDAAERIEKALSPFVNMAEALAELQRNLED